MKSAKTLLVLAVAASLMAAPAIAGATTVTAPSGTAYTGSTSASNEGSITIETTLDVTCNKSSMAGSFETHGSSVTAGVQLSTLTFTECNQHVSVVNKGSHEFHATSGGNATITSSGAEITISLTSIFGTIHCIIKTNNSHIGTATAAPGPTGHATYHINSGTLPAEGNVLCESAVWRGTYKINSPTGLRWD